jgi:hypothetical protein
MQHASGDGVSAVGKVGIGADTNNRLGAGSLAHRAQTVSKGQAKTAALRDKTPQTQRPKVTILYKLK